MDMVDFDLIEGEEEDYNLHDFPPEPLPYPIHHLIEYRIKLLLKNDGHFLPGETQVVNTSCMLKGKIKGAMSKFSTHVIPYENLPLSFESRGYISRKYSGRVVIKLTNYSTNSIKLNFGTPVGYLVMQPFSLN